jgi:hypothetical protein
MPADTSIQALQDPSIPQYDPLAQASVPQVPSQVMTTAAVNGPNGSVDNGGQIDKIAAAAAADDRLVAANAWSQNTFGMPLTAPSVGYTMARTGVMILGAFLGGYHGYKRYSGKPLPTTGFAIAGAVAPLLTLGVGLVQGYAKPRGRR